MPASRIPMLIFLLGAVGCAAPPQRRRDPAPTPPPALPSSPDLKGLSPTQGLPPVGYRLRCEGREKEDLARYCRASIEGLSNEVWQPLASLEAGLTPRLGLMQRLGVEFLVDLSVTFDGTTLKIEARTLLPRSESPLRSSSQAASRDLLHSDVPKAISALLKGFVGASGGLDPKALAGALFRSRGEDLRSELKGRETRVEDVLRQLAALDQSKAPVGETTRVLRNKAFEAVSIAVEAKCSDPAISVARLLDLLRQVQIGFPEQETALKQLAGRVFVASLGRVERELSMDRAFRARRTLLLIRQAFPDRETELLAVRARVVAKIPAAAKRVIRETTIEIDKRSRDNYADFLRRAEARESLEDWVAAAADYEKALQLRPDHAESASWADFVRKHAGREPRSKSAQTAIDQQTLALARRAVRWQRRGNHEAALVDLDKLLELNPTQAGALAARASSHQQMGAPDKAMADVSRAIELDPTNAYSFSKRGELHQEKRAFNKMLQDYLSAIALVDPDSASELTRLNLAMWHGLAGSAQDQLGRTREGIEEVSRGLVVLQTKSVAGLTRRGRRKPRLAFLLLLRGNMHAKAGNKAKAVADLRRCLEADPLLPEANKVQEKIRSLR